MQRPSSVRSISRPTSLTTTFRGPTGTFVACVVVVLVSLATWWARLDGPIDLRWDGGAYYILGTSLADGHGYRLLSEPGGIDEQPASASSCRASSRPVSAFWAVRTRSRWDTSCA